MNLFYEREGVAQGLVGLVLMEPDLGALVQPPGGQESEHHQAHADREPGDEA